MVQSKDASFKFISKNHLKELFEIFDIQFGMELDFSNIEVLSSEEIVIEPSLIRPDYIVKIGNVIFMIEFESHYVGTRKKKLFKLYISAFDYKNNDENNRIVFFVISTKENSKMAEYNINDWDSFKFPIISLKDLDKEEIINNIETKIENNEEFTNRELLELGLTPILDDTREKIIEQFFKTTEIMSRVEFPNLEIKESVYGLVLMLSSMFFDELDPLRNKIQGDLMGKVDCVMEACQKSYDEGVNKGISQGVEQNSLDVAKKMLSMGDYSLEEISDITGLSLDDVIGLKSNM